MAKHCEVCCTEISIANGIFTSCGHIACSKCLKNPDSCPQCGKEENFQVTSFKNLPSHLQHYVLPLEVGIEKLLDACRFQESHQSTVVECALLGKRKAEEECGNLQRQLMEAKKQLANAANLQKTIRGSSTPVQVRPRLSNSSGGSKEQLGFASVSRAESRGPPDAFERQLSGSGTQNRLGPSVQSPAQRGLSPHHTIMQSGKSPQILRQDFASDDHVQSSPMNRSGQPSPAAMRSRVIGSNLHSTAERSRPPSPATLRPVPLPECRTPGPCLQARVNGPYTPSSAATLARVAQPRTEARPDGKSLQTSGSIQMTNASMVAQRFGNGVNGTSNSVGGKPSLWPSNSSTPRAAPPSADGTKRLMTSNVQTPLTPMPGMQRNGQTRQQTGPLLSNPLLSRPSLGGSMLKQSLAELNRPRPK